MKKTIKSNYFPRSNNPSIQSVAAVTQLLEIDDPKDQINLETNSSKAKMRKAMISIIISHIDEFVKLVFEEPFSNTSYQTLLGSDKIQKSVASSQTFKQIANRIIKKGQNKTIGRLSEFANYFMLNNSREFIIYFPFIADLFNFCNIRFSSTLFLFADLISTIPCDLQQEMIKMLFKNNRYSVLNRIDKNSLFFKLPSSIKLAIKNASSTENWSLLCKFAEVPNNVKPLAKLGNSAVQIIDPTLHMNAFMQCQVCALKFVTKIIENGLIDEIFIERETLVKMVLSIMTTFPFHNFALKASVDFFTAAIRVVEVAGKIISIVFPAFVRIIEEKDRNFIFLSGFCKYCIDKITRINESLTESIPESVLKECYNWSELFYSNSNFN